METKTYLDPNAYLRDIWRLGRMILDDRAWRPDVLLALWRGGAPVGAAVHEFLDFHRISPRHMPIKCSSYSGIGVNNGDVIFHCADAVFAQLKPGERVLVVDDVFDTGKTAAAIRDRLAATGVEQRFACVYWKPGKNATELRPDYFVRQLGNGWIVFPHEMDGLSREEITAKDPVLASLVDWSQDPA